MPWRALLHTLVFLSLLGCMGAPTFRDCVPGDGGSDGDLERCLPDNDLEAVDPPVSDADAGVDPVTDFEIAACNTLVEDVCGAGDPRPCGDDAACAAATLLQQYEPSACGSALSNDVTYPTCRPGPCALLVDRVCGGQAEDAECSAAPGCQPARVLLTRSSSSDAQEREDAQASCNAALEDDVVFAPCQ